MKEGVILISLVLTCFLLVNIASAETLISNANVSYDSNLLKAFEGAKWVSIFVSIKDTSGITISKEDSIDIQRSKDLKRNTMLISITDNILSNLSDQEFQLKSKSEFGGFFAGNITREGFEKLLNEGRVKEIGDNSIKGHINFIVNIHRGSIVYVILALLIIISFFILIKLKKRKWKRKK